MGQSSARADAKRYRDGYPNDTGDDKEQSYNLLFYSNKLPCRPDGLLIDEVHTKWFGDYDGLEMRHGYIQWLFPIKEEGVNPQAQRLMSHEAAFIAANEQGRVFTSYRLMLDFYGMQLLDETSGEVARSGNWQPCFRNLQVSGHNYLRITRILKCLGEVGLERLKVPFLEFLCHEVLETKALDNCLRSLRDYWIPVLRDDGERERLATKWDLSLPAEPEDDGASSENGTLDDWDDTQSDFDSQASFPSLGSCPSSPGGDSAATDRAMTSGDPDEAPSLAESERAPSPPMDTSRSAPDQGKGQEGEAAAS